MLESRLFCPRRHLGNDSSFACKVGLEQFFNFLYDGLLFSSWSFIIFIYLGTTLGAPLARLPGNLSHPWDFDHGADLL